MAGDGDTRSSITPHSAIANSQLIRRRGQESNLPRLLRTDNGFEDREGHQAPFTLQKEENVQRPTPNAQRSIAEKKEDRLLEFFDRLDHGVEVRPVAGIEFGMKKLAIGANFKGTAAGWDERKRLDAFAEFENLGRQTDGLGRVVSNHAVFDRYFGLHSQLLSENEVIGAMKWGQEPVEAPCRPLL
jgi:hypothetical protein